MPTALHAVLILLTLSLHQSGCTTSRPSPAVQALPAWTNSATIPDDVYRHRFNHLLQTEVSRLQILTEEALALRAQTVIFLHNIGGKQAGSPFSSAELDRINRGVQQHLDVRRRLLPIASRYISWLDSEKVDKRITPELRFKGVMLSLAAALILYDNYALAVLKIERSTRLRRLVNKPDSGYGIRKNELTEVSRSFRALSQRRLFDKAVSLVKMNKTNRVVIESAMRHDRDLVYLDLLIEQSPSYQKFQTQTGWDKFANHIGLFSRQSFDFLRDLTEASVNEISKMFGNSIGLIQTRKGKLLHNPEVATHLRRELKPLDILLEKTPFRLTDKFIPGHFGHVAIWMGTEKDLRALGMWDHPLIVPYQPAIRSGRSVLEALRSGVVLSSLEDFLNVDDLAVVRHQKMSHDVFQATLVRGFRQLGKAYDFNFDVETTDRIVCSELAYVTFTDIPWPTENALGRSTISPDNVARMSLTGPLSLILFYHNGDLVKENVQALYRSMFEKETFGQHMQYPRAGGNL